ncbi:MAG: hypothetical protein Q9187_006411 [Circinaria calcarea]
MAVYYRKCMALLSSPSAKSIIVNVSHQLGVSILWNGANIIVRLSRPRPMHPGANVGMDLVLWLALIVTGLLATVAAVRNLNSISNESNNQSSKPVKNPDGTYSYIYGEYGYFQNGTYGFVPDGTPGARCPDFSSCAARAVATSSIHHLGMVEAVGSGFTFLAVLLHFTLFVWACVDVHRGNNGRVEGRAAAMAQTIIAQMADRGVLPSGQQTQRQQQTAPLLSPEGIHMSDSSPYDPGLRGSASSERPTDGGGHM